MGKKSPISQQRLLEVIEYEPENGIFRWRITKNKRAAVGVVAGNLAVNGYVRIFVDGQSYFAHRLAWFYMTGAWPEAQIDHRDGVRNNNRWANLRCVTNAQNACNSRTPTHNTSGFKGVSWSKVAGKWHAYVKVDGARRNLGMHDDIATAARVVSEARKRLHGEFANDGIVANNQRPPGVNPLTGRDWGASL
jgi:hypothetical protein